MTVTMTKTVRFNLSCGSHKTDFVWFENSYEGFLKALTENGWGYEFQNETIYYCPECLKELGLHPGNVDIRFTFTKKENTNG